MHADYNIKTLSYNRHNLCMWRIYGSLIPYNVFWAVARAPKITPRTIPCRVAELISYRTIHAYIMHVAYNINTPSYNRHNLCMWRIYGVLIPYNVFWAVARPPKINPRTIPCRVAELPNGVPRASTRALHVPNGNPDVRNGGPELQNRSLELPVGAPRVQSLEKSGSLGTWGMFR